MCVADDCTSGRWDEDGPGSHPGPPRGVAKTRLIARRGCVLRSRSRTDRGLKGFHSARSQSSSQGCRRIITAASSWFALRRASPDLSMTREMGFSGCTPPLWRSARRSDRPKHRRASLRASVSSDRSAQGLGVHEGVRRLRWQRSVGSGAVTNGGRRRCTKSREGSRVYRQEKRLFMSQGSSPPRAISSTWTSPVR